MEKKLILRGLLAGAVGGLLAFVFARIFAEPLIQRAIDYEGGRAAAEAALHGINLPADEAEVVTRSVQENAGLGIGLVFFGETANEQSLEFRIQETGQEGGIVCRSANVEAVDDA